MITNKQAPHKPPRDRIRLGHTFARTTVGIYSRAIRGKDQAAPCWNSIMQRSGRAAQPLGK
jgi:hypothetical protein